MEFHVSSGADSSCESTSGLIEGFALLEPGFAIGNDDLREEVSVAYEEAVSSANRQQLFARTFD